MAEELDRRGWRLAFVGNPDSMESRLAERQAIEFHSVPAVAFVGQGLAARARALLVLLRSIVRAWSLLRGLRPAIVLGTGGFVAVPTVIASRLRGCPVVLLAHGVPHRVLRDHDGEDGDGDG